MAAAAEGLETDRRLLWGLCYRMTGNAADADDLVQETFVRALERPPRNTEQPLRPWLIRVALNLSRDLLRKRRRRGYAGEWLPSPVPTEELEALPSFEPVAPQEDSPAAQYDLMESVSFAFLLALEALTPTQRAVLLLRDVFDYSTKETADALGVTDANVKVCLLRARGKMKAYDTNRPTAASAHSVREALERFMTCLKTGDAAGLERLLAEDAVSTSDGGGEVRAALRTVAGRERVSRLVFGLASKMPPSPAISFIDVNGAPALLFDLGRVPKGLAAKFVLRCEIDSLGRIQSLQIVLAPTKLTAVVQTSPSGGRVFSPQ
jgi:RNA polymerase sigma-70 factor (ECF subfamily)